MSPDGGYGDGSDIQGCGIMSLGYGQGKGVSGSNVISPVYTYSLGPISPPAWHVGDGIIATLA